MMSHVVCVSAVEVRSIWASRWSLIHLWGTAGASPLTWKHVRCTLNVLSHMFRASENFLAVLDDIKFWMTCEICIVYKRLVWPTRAKRIWIVTMKQFQKPEAHGAMDAVEPWSSPCGPGLLWLLWLLSLQAEKAMEPLGMSLGHDYMGLGAQTGCRDGSMRYANH